MTFYEIARQYFPRESEKEIDWIIWSRTGYPCFFTGDVETIFRRQLMDHKYFLILHGNVARCDFCDKPAVREHAFMQCQTCGDDWDLQRKYDDLCRKISHNYNAYRELDNYLYPIREKS